MDVSVVIITIIADGLMVQTNQDRCCAYNNSKHWTTQCRRVSHLPANKNGNKNDISCVISNRVSTDRVCRHMTQLDTRHNYNERVHRYGRHTCKQISHIVQINKVLYNFSKVNCQTKTRLLKAYCTSFYEAELWDLSQNDIESVFTAWRIYGIFQIPRILLSYQTYKRYLAAVGHVYMRMVNFIYKCLRSESSLVQVKSYR